jgi:mRNA interferase HicA
VTASELKRWLKEQGCTFEEKKRHTLVRFRSRCSLLPRHPAKEIKAGTLNGILRDLGLKMK